jgi:hypothetical protein
MRIGIRNLAVLSCAKCGSPVLIMTGEHIHPTGHCSIYLSAGNMVGISGECKRCYTRYNCADVTSVFPKMERGEKA